MTPWYISLLMYVACGLTCFIIGYKRGMTYGIDISMDVTITRTLEELKKSAERIGLTDIFKQIVDAAFNDAKLRDAKKRTEEIMDK